MPETLYEGRHYPLWPHPHGLLGQSALHGAIQPGLSKVSRSVAECPKYGWTWQTTPMGVCTSPTLELSLVNWLIDSPLA